MPPPKVEPFVIVGDDFTFRPLKPWIHLDELREELRLLGVPWAMPVEQEACLMAQQNPGPTQADPAGNRGVPAWCRPRLCPLVRGRERRPKRALGRFRMRGCCAPLRGARAASRRAHSCSHPPDRRRRIFASNWMAPSAYLR
jgi:hypothetical protein